MNRFESRRRDSTNQIFLHDSRRDGKFPLLGKRFFVSSYNLSRLSFSRSTRERAIHHAFKHRNQSVTGGGIAQVAKTLVPALRGHHAGGGASSSTLHRGVNNPGQDGKTVGGSVDETYHGRMNLVPRKERQRDQVNRRETTQPQRNAKAVLPPGNPQVF